MKTIVIAAGGTGGHFFPALTLWQELSHRGYKVIFITDTRCESYISEELKPYCYILDTKQLSKKNLIYKLLSIIKLIGVIFNTARLFRQHAPDICIGFGGYPSLPPLCAAVILRIVIILYEQNCFIGRVNKLFLRFAKIIALTSANTFNLDKKYCNKMLIAGHIVRKDIINIVRKKNNNLFRIFIFGGSQGAQVFSTIIPQSINLIMQKMPDTKLYITQQAKEADKETIDQIYKSLDIQYNLSDFFHDMNIQYQNADLIIARAGASTIAELKATGVPAILIPYPHALDNHQYYNAKALEKDGVAWCFTQSGAVPNVIADKILSLINDRSLLQEAAQIANHKKNTVHGQQVIADTVEKIIS